MIRNSLFQRHFLVSAIAIIAFILWGFWVSRWVMNLSRDASKFAPPPVFIAKLLDVINPSDRVQAMQKIENVGQPMPMTKVLIDASGKVEFPPDFKLDFEWSGIEKPKNDYDFVEVSSEKFGPFGDVLVKLPGSPVQYFYGKIRSGERGGPPPMWGGFVILIVSVLFGVAASLFLIYRSLRQSAQLADQVISDLQSGNLKARFPIKRMDEIGKAMTRFNLMADEIEHLVERLRESESTRMKMLQELAHDLRTPIASLKNLLETLSQKEASLDQKVKAEVMNLSVEEVSYFERLVEDLLFLAQVSEPRYKLNRGNVDLSDLLDDETLHRGGPKQIKIQKLSERATVVGDSHLLRRQIRNGIENAVSFAKSEVNVTLSSDAHWVTITIDDDGPGFSQEAMESFGKRRVTRALEGKRNDRLSVGLGSVIMESVSEVHRGKIEVSNQTGGGARIKISLPR